MEKLNFISNITYSIIDFLLHQIFNSVIIVHDFISLFRKNFVQKFSEYLSISYITTSRLKIQEFEESLKNYNQLTLLFAIIVYFYVLKMFLSLSYHIWMRISNYVIYTL